MTTNHRIFEQEDYDGSLLLGKSVVPLPHTYIVPFSAEVYVECQKHDGSKKARVTNVIGLRLRFAGRDLGVLQAKASQNGMIQVGTTVGAYYHQPIVGLSRIPLTSNGGVLIAQAPFGRDWADTNVLLTRYRVPGVTRTTMTTPISVGRFFNQFGQGGVQVSLSPIINATWGHHRTNERGLTSKTRPPVRPLYTRSQRSLRRDHRVGHGPDAQDQLPVDLLV